MSRHLGEAMLYLQRAAQALEAHVDAAPSPRSRQRGQELAGATRRVTRATRALEHRDRTAERAAA